MEASTSVRDTRVPYRLIRYGFVIQPVPSSYPLICHPLAVGQDVQ